MTTCRRWTTTICAAGGRHVTKHSMKPPRSWSATRCKCLAFELLAEGPGLPNEASVRLKLVQLLAIASGTSGMAGGQALDLAAIGRKLSPGRSRRDACPQDRRADSCLRDDGRGLRSATFRDASRAYWMNMPAPSVSHFRFRMTCWMSKAMSPSSAKRPARIRRSINPPILPSPASSRRVSACTSYTLAPCRHWPSWMQSGLHSAPLAAMSDWLVLRKY